MVNNIAQTLKTGKRACAGEIQSTVNGAQAATPAAQSFSCCRPPKLQKYSTMPQQLPSLAKH
jgi:hypothetical protein